MLCEGRRTLVGLLRRVGESPSLAGLSRFLSESPWQGNEIVESWLKHFREEMQPLVEAERQRQRMQQPKRPGRRKRPLVIGYLIGDDSTMHKPKGKKPVYLASAQTTHPAISYRLLSLIEHTTPCTCLSLSL